MKKTYKQQRKEILMRTDISQDEKAKLIKQNIQNQKAFLTLQVYKSLGLNRVKGNLGGVYYE